jgi:hypothetical protein
MNSRNDNFDELQRLLALKRREQPPDSFFHGFPEQVRDHLHDPTPARPLSWSEQYGFDSPFRPVWLCGIGVLLCGLLALGVISTRWIRSDDQEAASNLRAPSTPAPPLTGDSLPDSAAPLETKSPLEPVSTSGASPFEQPILGNSTQKTRFPVPPSNR